MKKLESSHEFKRGSIAGSIGSVIMFLFVESFFRLGITELGQSFLAAGTVFEYKEGPLMTVIALIMSIFLGSFWGVVAAFLYSKVFTRELLLLKGIGLGFAIAFLNLGILDDTFYYAREFHQKTLTVIVFFCGYFIYGLITSYLLLKMGLPDE